MLLAISASGVTFEKSLNTRLPFLRCHSERGDVIPFADHIMKSGNLLFL
jgi:hypothetical protein